MLRTALHMLGSLCIVACSAPPDATAQRPARPPQAPEHDTEIHALQARLGASAITCSGTATILADQGTASPATVTWRQAAVQRLCVQDQWPERVRRCVATADHDPLSCTGYLETADQRTRWSTVFDKWLESAGD